MSFLSNLFNTNPYPVYTVNDNNFENTEELYTLIAELVDELAVVEAERNAYEEMLEANDEFIDELIDETCEQNEVIYILANKLGEVAQTAMQALLSLGYDINIQTVQVEDDDE